MIGPCQEKNCKFWYCGEPQCSEDQTHPEAHLKLHTKSVVFERIAAERDAQDFKFGPLEYCMVDMTDDRYVTDDRYMTILTEEYLELTRAINDGEPPWRVQEEMIQVAAVITKWLESRNVQFGRKEKETQ